ncbi:TetR/AcrR family transcriptional regulator [Actinomadura sp. CNU-125]|uniref:TetR/AcrR family transcriptional regulator n=1 Tax=Actinomadura sp. CNU-125 TaxID=1904961 RepID=UPI0021CD0317|nr:TetR/AcrR family transcriptional regulator [Actinomadura sp. CNU-125]
MTLAHIVEHGFDATSVRTIAREVGVTVPALPPLREQAGRAGRPVRPRHVRRHGACRSLSNV